MDCQDLVDQISDKYRAVAETVRKVLRGTLELAVKREWLARNPLNDRKLKVIKRQPEVRTPTKEELRHLLEHVDNSHTERGAVLRLIVMLGVFAGGMRKGEQCGLRWQDIDWDNGILHIQHGICPVTGKLKGTKTKTSNRKVPMIPAVRDALQPMWQMQGHPSDGSVLRVRGGGHAYSVHGQYWKQLMRGAGLVEAEGRPRFTPHALRHAAVPLLVEHGVPLLEIARLVGHKALDLTIGTYAYIFKDAEDRATPAMTAAYEALVPSNAVENAPVVHARPEL